LPSAPHRVARLATEGGRRSYPLARAGDRSGTTRRAAHDRPRQSRQEGSLAEPGVDHACLPPRLCGGGATALLVVDLIKGSGVTNSPSELLASGGVVWLGNNLSFALLYWLIDSGGAVARPHPGGPGRVPLSPPQRA